MNLHSESKQFDVKREEDPLSLVEIKTEPQDSQCEIKSETEECDTFFEHVDIKHENEPSFQFVPCIKIKSEVKGTQENWNHFLEDYEKKLKHEEKNTDNETNVPILYDPCWIYRTDLQEENCGDYRGESSDPKSASRTQTADGCLTCSICNESFSQKLSLVSHYTFCHPNEKAFKCSICSKTFLDKYTLIIHKCIRMNEKPYKCNVCNKPFSRKIYLTVHTRTHTNEKPFKCNICSKSFSHKSTLKGHIRTHTNEKPFKCNTCNKSFSWKPDLTRHTRIHTNEKPFKCNVCNKSFSQKSHLTTHTNRAGCVKTSISK